MSLKLARPDPFQYHSLSERRMRFAGILQTGSFRSKHMGQCKHAAQAPMPLKTRSLNHVRPEHGKHTEDNLVLPKKCP